MYAQSQAALNAKSTTCLSQSVPCVIRASTNVVTYKLDASFPKLDSQVHNWQGWRQIHVALTAAGTVLLTLVVLTLALLTLPTILCNNGLEKRVILCPCCTLSLNTACLAMPWHSHTTQITPAAHTQRCAKQVQQAQHKCACC